MATKEMKTLKLPNSQDIYKIVDGEALHFTEQTLTEEQKEQAKINLGLGNGSGVIKLLSGDLNDYKEPGTRIFIPSESSANV